MTVRLQRWHEYALITIEREAALNALSFQILRDLGDLFDTVATQPEPRALFITGSGPKAFCAGADIGELRNRSLAEQRRGAELGQSVFAKLDSLPIASVALVNGYAMGGGLELALACTFRIAARNARFALPEIKLGLIPGYGGTQRLPRLVGASRALDLIMTGRTIGSEEAERIGLVDRVVDGDLRTAGLDFARSFSGHGLRALEFARKAVLRGQNLGLEQALEVEKDMSTLAYRTADAEEGMAAFMEKRKPEFRDG